MNIKTYQLKILMNLSSTLPLRVLNAVILLFSFPAFSTTLSTESTVHGYASGTLVLQDQIGTSIATLFLSGFSSWDQINDCYVRSTIDGKSKILNARKAMNDTPTAVFTVGQWIEKDVSASFYLTCTGNSSAELTLSGDGESNSGTKYNPITFAPKIHIDASNSCSIDLETEVNLGSLLPGESNSEQVLAKNGNGTGTLVIIPSAADSDGYGELSDNNGHQLKYELLKDGIRKAVSSDGSTGFSLDGNLTIKAAKIPAGQSSGAYTGTMVAQLTCD